MGAPEQSSVIQSIQVRTTGRCTCMSTGLLGMSLAYHQLDNRTCSFRAQHGEWGQYCAKVCPQDSDSRSRALSALPRAPLTDPVTPHSQLRSVGSRALQPHLQHNGRSWPTRKTEFYTFSVLARATKLTSYYPIRNEDVPGRVLLPNVAARWKMPVCKGN